MRTCKFVAAPRLCSRRGLLKQSARVAGALAAGGLLGLRPAAAEDSAASGSRKTGFFTVASRNGHWWLITPEGQAFWSIGMNHIDSATLRYPENAHIWRDKYHNSQERWLKEAVARDLVAWGFNTVGWVQEVVTRHETNHRHSRNFTYEEYQWLGMPYCHMLPFADFHQWEAETRHPDLFSTAFEDWCDYVARAECSRFRDDPKLIGYFYIDCPTWVHVRPLNRWKGPLFDPEKLETEAGRRELFDLATRYYQVTHDAIRRYDPNHLILGDRYEGNAPLPDEVLEAAAPFVDVLSFQYFGPPEPVARDFRRWHELTGKPLLLADASALDQRRRPKGKTQHTYATQIRTYRELPCCVGWHVCGAYLRNRVRNYGFRDETETADTALIEGVIQANRETAEYVQSAAVP